MAYCWENIYQGLKKIKTWNLKMTVRNIMVQSHQSFVTISNISSKSVFIN